MLKITICMYPFYRCSINLSGIYHLKVLGRIDKSLLYIVLEIILE